MFFVVSKKIRTGIHGEKHIFYHGTAHPYGDFFEEYGFDTRKKAQLEIKRLERFFDKRNERMLFFIEDKTITKLKQ